MWQRVWKSLEGIGSGEACEVAQISGRAWFHRSVHVFQRLRV